MNILTAAQMRDLDRRTIQAGIPELILMENAAHRLLEALHKHFPPLAHQRITILCGKGNNGGDGLALARLLAITTRPAALHVALTDPPAPNTSAAAQLDMLRAHNIPVETEITPAMRHATLVVDALLGTGTHGPARGRPAAWITEINHGFPLARVAAVDIPSGLDSDQPSTQTPYARADLTVTFTAPKPAHALPPNCDRMGTLVIAPVGSPQRLLDQAPLHWLTPAHFPAVLEPRPRAGHKGTFGHVLVIGGAPGKTGAAHLAGLAALRTGAGLVTVASAAPPGTLPPELMTNPLDAPELAGKSVVALGPGLGPDPRVFDWFQRLSLPAVLDADALNVLATQPGWRVPADGPLRVFTPHPGEMARLHPGSTAPRLQQAQDFAAQTNAVLVLKGQRTLIAFPDGPVYVNPTGSPALAKGGSGDILTGLIAGLLAQHPAHPRQAILAAVWLHGQAGECAAEALTESGVLATDLLTYLPHALRLANHRH